MSNEELVEKYQIATNKKKLLGDIVKANMGLVYKITQKYQKYSLYEDILQEGIMGLMTAANKFDKSLNYKFSTYAYWWIKMFVTRYLDINSRTIRLPTYSNKIIKDFNDLTCLKQKKGQKIVIKEIAEELKIKEKTLTDILLNNTSLSTDFTIEVGGSDFAFTNHSALDTYELEDHRDYFDIEVSNLCLDKFYDILTETESYIIKAYHGVGHPDEKCLTFQAIGDILNISRQRVEQIYKQALNKIRNTFIRKDHNDIIN